MYRLVEGTDIPVTYTEGSEPAWKIDTQAFLNKASFPGLPTKADLNDEFTRCQLYVNRALQKSSLCKKDLTPTQCDSLRQKLEAFYNIKIENLAVEQVKFSKFPALEDLGMAFCNLALPGTTAPVAKKENPKYCKQCLKVVSTLQRFKKPEKDWVSNIIYLRAARLSSALFRLYGQTGEVLTWDSIWGYLNSKPSGGIVPGIITGTDALVPNWDSVIQELRSTNIRTQHTGFCKLVLPSCA